MRIIADMSKQLENELDGVIDYAKDAVTYRASMPQIADMYYRMANTENGHVRMLHDQLVKLATEAKNSGRTYPPEMEEKWELKHRELIGRMATAQTFLDMYK